MLISESAICSVCDAALDMFSVLRLNVAQPQEGWKTHNTGCQGHKVCETQGPASGGVFWRGWALVGCRRIGGLGQAQSSIFSTWVDPLSCISDIGYLHYDS